MKLGSRVRAAITAFRAGETPRSMRARRQLKGGTQPFMLWPSYVSGQPQWDMVDLESYINDGFNLNSIIYSAIMYKVRALTSVQLRAYTGTRGNPDFLEDTHPLAQLLRRPNPYMTEHDFKALTSVFFNIAGNAYLYLRREQADVDLPTYIWPLRPDRVRIVPDRENMGEVLGYIYVPEGQSLRDGFPILADDMVHIKMPNPGDPLNGAGYGMSPLSPLARSANVDNDVTAFLRMFFERGAMFQHVLRFDMPLDEHEVSRARQRWQERYGGIENWGDVAILDSGAQIDRMTPTFEEMGFDSIDERSETRILGPLGVPPILIGTRTGLARSTFSNYEEARRAFWEDTMLPELRWFEGALETRLVAQDGAFVLYDTSTVPALRQDMRSMTEAALNLYNMGVPPRVAFKTVGLRVAEFDGDMTIKQEAMPDDDQAPRPEARAGAMPLESKAYDPRAMQKGMDDVAINWEAQFEEAAASAFERDRRHVLALVSEEQRTALSRKGSIRWSDLRASILDYIQDRSIEAWRADFIPLIEGVVLDTGGLWATALGVQFDVRNLRGEAWFQDYTLQFADPISQTSADTLHDVLAQAQAEGWTIAEMQDRMGRVFDQWIQGDLTPDDFNWLTQRMPLHRRELIARVETMRAANAGAYQLGRDWGVKTKEWLAALDERTRDTHREANGQVVGINETFTVGGYAMMHPLDMNRGAPPEEAMNCRCTMILGEIEG